MTTNTTKNPKAESQTRWKQRTRFLFAVGFLLMMIAAIIFYRLPPKLEAGQVIDTCGLYRFPSGGHQLEIRKTAENNLKITIHRRVVEFSLFSIPVYSRLAPDRPSHFEAERDWFVAVDRYQRLWVYYGRWDREWGEKRKMPSGGTVPYASSVSMEGSWFLPSGELATGYNSARMTDFWQGVPSAFLERIPKEFYDPQKWPDMPPVPESAPAYTKQQETMLYQKLKQ